MKATKRISALLLGLLLTMSLVACGAKDSGKDPAPEQKEFSVGVTEGSTYTNKYFGFTTTLEGWTFLDQEQLSQITGQVSDLLDDEAITQMYADGRVVMEMYAGDETGNTVNVTVENLGEANGAKYDESKYVDASVAALPDQMATAGYSDVSAEKITATFAGAQHYGIAVTATANGVSLYETLVCIKVGNYVCTVTAATIEADATAEILSRFTVA